MKRLPHILLSLGATMISTSLLGAEQWEGFGIKHLGFVFDVPPGFVLAQRSDQGAAFEGKNKAFLAIWGAQLGKASFRTEIEHRIAVNENDGWKVTYKRVTPQWASYSSHCRERERRLEGDLQASDPAMGQLFGTEGRSDPVCPGYQDLRGQSGIVYGQLCSQ
ncbi:hypothetical protein [Mesorhizobium sp. LNHC229A00]|uniref:hypothetical protein n=1 Tax=Mesorhizobium sp. LNHC229A00 TaxID=1287240 RepID=UPI001FD9A7F0|nr:hypothetical protein [Mesorhizobium sp. LNHC229A00]